MFSTLRSAYAWLLLSVIVLALFVVAPLVWLVLTPIDPRRDRFRVFVATWVSLYGWLTPLYRFHIEGRDRLPKRGAYVLVANHESGLDTLAVLMLRTPARILGERAYFRIPIAGWVFRACRHVPVKTGDRDSGRRALDEVTEGLRAGAPAAIFPEGGLFPDGMAEFRVGAFVAAQRAAVPIVPVVLEGLGTAWRPGTMVVQGKHELRIRVLEPIPVEDVSGVDAAALAERVRGSIATALAHQR